MPLAAPALWAISAGREAHLGQVALVLPWAAVFCGFTLWFWRRLELDR
jgi:hypothetical protein